MAEKLSKGAAWNIIVSVFEMVDPSIKMFYSSKAVFSDLDDAFEREIIISFLNIGSLLEDDKLFEVLIEKGEDDDHDNYYQIFRLGEELYKLIYSIDSVGGMMNYFEIYRVKEEVQTIKRYV
jgi:hypothetical protein